MSRLRPVEIEAPPAKDADVRLGHLAEVGDRADARVALVGFPSDEGVRRNGGRPGAAEGPAALRRCLWKLTPDARDAAGRQRALLESTVDLGDVPVSGDLARDRELLAEVVAEQLERGRFVVVLGGGHETTYGHFLGYVAAGIDAGILNFDAHPDVRAPAWGDDGDGGDDGHSGSPFRQALEHDSGRCRSYDVVGLCPWSTARAHVEWLEERDGEARFLSGELERRLIEDARGLFTEIEPELVSFDLDAVDGASAPGVSAPAARGLSVTAWLAAARAAGGASTVRSVDVVELSPPHDPDLRTARLAALTVWQVLAGLAER